MLEEERRDEPEAEAPQPAESRPAEEPSVQPTPEPPVEPQPQPPAEAVESRPEPAADEPRPAEAPEPQVQAEAAAGAQEPVEPPAEASKEGEVVQPPKRRGVPPPKDPEKGGYICDAMLGRLARELRMRGLDVFYQRNLGGMMAFRQSRQSGRTLLTRNHRLKGLPGVVSIESNNIREQVAQVTGQPVEPAPEPPAVTEAGAGQPEASTEAPPAPAGQRDERPPERRQEQRREQRPPREQRPEQRREREPRPEGEARHAPEPQFGRCLACNTPLEQISRDAARPSIPFFIYQIHHDFRRCPKCKKVFWPGSHVQDMERRVRPQGRPPRRRGRR